MRVGIDDVLLLPVALIGVLSLDADVGGEGYSHEDDRNDLLVVLYVS